jgi:putative methyltransferase (TIGR04325 family)
VVFEKTKRLRDRLAARPTPLDLGTTDTRMVLAVRGLAIGDSLTVVDFGGACGAHYFTTRAFLPADVSLRWCVVETSAMAGRARELENGELSFVDGVVDASGRVGRPDLVFSSGALQYVDEPYSVLEQLLGLGSASVMFARLAMSSEPLDLVTVQRSLLSAHGPGLMPVGFADGSAMCPLQIIRRDRLEEIVGRSYEIELRFAEQEGTQVLAGHRIDQYGYLARARQH